MSSISSTVYLHGRKLQTETGFEVHCDFYSQAVIFVSHFCKAKFLRVIFIDSPSRDYPYKLCSNALSTLKVDFLDFDRAPESVQACCLPAVCCSGESLIRAGFGCTVRYIVSVQHLHNSSSNLIALLVSICLLP